ncbi:MAG: hypothetical protein KAT68_10100 [Bacteroidales bacterium]|nr:hypothetical protein [Bacteroidales bacterium]
MAFNLETFFYDIFRPEEGENVTIMYDFPHDHIKDNIDWKERRLMAEQWREKLNNIKSYKINVMPLASYPATGSNNADLPLKCHWGSQEIHIEEVIKESSIILSMPEFSATAPLSYYALKSNKLRVGSMPHVAKFMEETGLSANYRQISNIGKELKVILDPAIGAEVEFSTGHKCYFDLSKSNFYIDDGILYPERAGGEYSVSNLPAGEVYCVPNENDDSKTNGELPQKIGNDIVVYCVQNNRIKEVRGESNEIKEIRKKFTSEPGIQNIAEFAIGINDKAKVTGNILEDEKAGFHWAYGRSDFLGGNVGPKNFTNQQNIVHTDIVYAKESPITCNKLEIIFSDNKRLVLIDKGIVQINAKK